MARIRLIYGTSTGNTLYVANLIKAELGDLIDSVIDVADASPDDFNAAEALILGASTWEDGQLQGDWKRFFPSLDQIDLRGKTVALFGLGDANGFSGEFVSALGSLYDKVLQRGAHVVGFWPADSYDFSHSTALADGQFVGLVIDEDNQPELTGQRVKQWVESIRPAFAS